MNTYSTHVLNQIKQKYPEQSQFLQAVKNLFDSINPVLQAHPELQEAAILERIVEAERIIIFRVPWLDDQGKIHVNTGYRVQFSSVNGPYKGGLRFHPTVNLDIMKALAFEQTFKNALTGLALGGAKGGADFDPRGKSDYEVMRFCQSFVTELQKYIGADTDVPAGDIGVGAREIGYMYGQYQRLNPAAKPGVFTGKPVQVGGSFIRTEATGYGVVYFLGHILKADGEELAGKKVAISGAGNVAYHAAKKVDELGGIIVSLSDEKGAIYRPDGLNMAIIHQLKDDLKENTQLYCQHDLEAQYFFESIWSQKIKADIALPCATQNEISQTQAEQMIANGIRYVIEGANLPCDTHAKKIFKENNVVFAPGKAANAGGVAVSAFEMSQNAMRLSWTSEKVDCELQNTMKYIFDQCDEVNHEYDLGQDFGTAADIASFVKIAELVKMYGVV